MAEYKASGLIERAKERFKECEEAEHEVRAQSLDDLRFRAGEQWPVKIKAIRDAQMRPCLTVNVLPSRERQILNDQRQNRPAIQVNPVDDYGDPDTAEVLQGIVRHIEYDSNAEAAYDTACAAQVRGGFGYIGVITEYETPLDEAVDKVDAGSGKRKIKIRRFRNQYSVYLDPNAVEADRSDARFGFVFTYITKDEYETKYGKNSADEKSYLASLDDWRGIGDRAAGWLQDDKHVRIAEYYYRDTAKKTVYQLADGSIQTREPQGGAVKSFEAELPVIKCCVIDGFDELESTELPGSGQWIPLIPVLGDEFEVDGKLVLEGVVRHTKDVVRMQNYLASAEVEAIGIGKSGSWLVAEGQIEGHEQEWKDPNARILHYKPIDVTGKLVAEPKLITAEPAIAAITNARGQFALDLQHVTGIYDAQLGARSNETTGKAIQARKVQGEIGNYHFIDNLTRSIRHLGRLVIDWIPDVYDTPRVLRIIGEDGEQKTVKVNQGFNEGGVQKIYDLTVGRYDVTVSAGPSYQTKRQQALDSMVQMTQAYPQLMQVAGDLMAKNMDWPGARELADRLKKTLPPGLADDDSQDPQQAVTVLQGKLQQLSQAHQALNTYAQQLEKEKDGKVVEQQGKQQIAQMQEMTRLEIVKMQEATKIAVAQINASKDANQQIAEAEIEKYKLLGQAALKEQDQSHELGMTAVQQSHEQNMSDAQHQQALEQQNQAGQQAMMQQQQQAELNPPQESAE